MVLTFNTKSEFIEAFVKKYSSSMTFHQLAARTKSLWECRVKHAEEIRELQSKEQDARDLATRREQEHNHTVMIPARIVSRHATPRDSVPDVGELLINTNNLLAELVQLQKEQIGMFRELKEARK